MAASCPVRTELTSSELLSDSGWTKTLEGAALLGSKRGRVAKSRAAFTVCGRAACLGGSSICT
eukprot:6200946-Pleurochrysis_carterae.AAC.5